MAQPTPLPASLAALAALEDLTARGAFLAMPGPGRLAVCPPDATTPPVLAALRDARPWLLATWQAAAAFDAAHPPRPAADPLPPGPGASADDAADAAAWAVVLAQAAAADAAEPFGLTGRLRFARSMGARLRPTAGGLALRMPAGHPDAGPVAEALEGQGEALRRVLDLAADASRAQASQRRPAASRKGGSDARAA